MPAAKTVELKVNISTSLMKEIERYRFDHMKNTRTAAVRELLRKALKPGAKKKARTMRKRSA